MSDLKKDIEKIVKSTLVIDNKKGIPFFSDKMESYIQKRIKDAVDEEKQSIRELLIDEDLEIISEKI